MSQNVPELKQINILMKLFLITIILYSIFVVIYALYTMHIQRKLRQEISYWKQLFYNEKQQHISTTETESQVLEEINKIFNDHR